MRRCFSRRGIFAMKKCSYFWDNFPSAPLTLNSRGMFFFLFFPFQWIFDPGPTWSVVVQHLSGMMQNLPDRTTASPWMSRSPQIRGKFSFRLDIPTDYISTWNMSAICPQLRDGYSHQALSGFDYLTNPLQAILTLFVKMPKILLFYVTLGVGSGTSSLRDANNSKSARIG